MTSHRDNPAFGQLCDAVAYRRLIAVTGSGVSVGLPNRYSGREGLPTWHAVLCSLRDRFADQLSPVARELDLLLGSHLYGAEYLIEAATLIRECVGAAAFREAVVELTTPADRSYSALHDLIEELEPLGIITFNYDMGHEHAYHARRRGRRARLQRAIYSDEGRLRRVLAGDFESRFLLKAHGCISRPRSIVLDRSSYRQIIARQLGYRAFIHHVLARFNTLIVGFGLNDPDFDDLLQTFEAAFGGGVRNHVYIWKRGQRPDEEARAVVLHRRYGLGCIFVDSFDEVRTVIADARAHMGPRLRHAIAESLMRGAEVGEYRQRRRNAHLALAELSAAGAHVATETLKAHARDMTLRAAVRAEAVYSLGKVRPTMDGTVEFLLRQVTADDDPEVATYALAALLQLEPPMDREMESLIRMAASLWPVCERIDARISAQGGRAGRPRARKYLEALLARWEASMS